MKYIRQAKNTKLKGKLHDDFVTEVVPEEVFSSAHEKMGGWELVSEEECKRLCDLAEDHREAFKEARQAKANEASLLRKVQNEAQRLEDEKLKAEFEEFKKWKASQETT